MDISRRNFIGGMASCGLLGGCCIGRSQNARLRFGVVSDVHVRVAADFKGMANGYDTTTLEQTFAWYRDQGVDAVMIAGDMADTGFICELQAVADAWYRVFPNDRAPDGRKVERVFVFGNHDAYGRRYGGKFFKSPDEVRRASIEFQPAAAWDRCFHEEWKQYAVKSVKGYDFFCSHWKPGIWCNGYAETAMNGCAEAFAGQMARCDPSRPFFYVQHAHPLDTVYDKGCAWGTDDGTSTKLLSAFPQAVAFSGHSHQPLTNEKSIWRGAFTSIATGSLRYGAAAQIYSGIQQRGYENGPCNVYLKGIDRAHRADWQVKFDAGKVMTNDVYNHDIRTGLLVDVFDDRIEFMKREFLSGLEISTPWIVELPAKPKAFEVLAKTSLPAEFPAGSILTLARTTAKTRGHKDRKVASQKVAAVELNFPAAVNGGHVAEYEIAASNDAGAKYVTRICAIGGLYPRGHKKFALAVKATLAASDLPKDARLFTVTPLDSYANRGRSLTARL